MIRLVFFTSNMTKLAHARHVAEGFPINVLGFRQQTYRADYNEPRYVSRTEMLVKSYVSALEQFEKSGFDPKTTFFFLEDTSVRIEALSVGDKDFPGLDIKYWMDEVTFDEVDRELWARGNDRRAQVRSDVLLHIPSRYAARFSNSQPFQVFVGKQEGIITDKEVNFRQNLVFPWLDDRTFNKWFQPIGGTVPLGALDIGKADTVDFRRGSFRAMFSFLTSKLPQQRKPTQFEMNLEQDEDIILCGYTCAGKTTASQLLARRFGYLHVEASDFMYLSFFLRHGYRTDISISEFAEQALVQKPSIAAKQVGEYLEENLSLPAVISGFRSMLEVKALQEQLAYASRKFKLVFVDAKEQNRFTRLQNRGRPGDHISFEEFRIKDEEQKRMGLGEILTQIGTEIWKNNHSLKTWKDFVAGNVVPRIEKRLEVEDAVSKVSERKSVKLEEGILVALLSMWDDDEKTRKYFTTTEIVNILNELFGKIRPKHKDNVSRYFNQGFHSYYEVYQTPGGERREFRLSNTGYGKALQTLRNMLEHKES